MSDALLVSVAEITAISSSRREALDLGQPGLLAGRGSKVEIVRCNPRKALPIESGTGLSGALSRETA